MFAVLYRWRLKAGTELAFREAWKAMTESIKLQYGTGGSRLHRTDKGEIVAYAVWPSRERREEAAEQPSTNPDAAAKMRACIEETFETTKLDVLDDLLSRTS